MIKKIVAIATLACSLSFAGGLVQSVQPQKPSGKKLWWATVAALAAATALDARSSWGKQELNPLLQAGNGSFGARGIEIKSALVGAGIAAQWLALRHHHNVEKPASFMNMAVAGITVGAAVHNTR